MRSFFSDFKTRGFGPEDTRLERTDRVARLLLILSVALHRCVFTGISDRLENPLPREKKLKNLDSMILKTKTSRGTALPAVVRENRRSACSFFKRGLRVLRKYAQKLKRLPLVFFYTLMLRTPIKNQGVTRQRKRGICRFCVSAA